MAATEIKRVRPAQVDDLQWIARKTFHDAFMDSNPAEDMHQYMDEAFAAEKLAVRLSVVRLSPSSTWLVSTSTIPIAVTPSLAGLSASTSLWYGLVQISHPWQS